MHTTSIKKEDVSALTDDINIALALLERDYSVSLNNITTHILRHVAEKIETKRAPKINQNMQQARRKTT